MNITITITDASPSDLATISNALLLQKFSNSPEVRKSAAAGCAMRRARLDAGYRTQGEVATKLGVSRATLSNIECGKTGATGSRVAAKLAELYGVPLQEILSKE